MYADDPELYLSFLKKDWVTAEINSDLGSLSKAATEHSLNLNPTESAVMTFGKDRELLSKM